MPFDGKNFQTKPDVFSLNGLIAWLETQDPATEYNYADCHGECLIGRYLQAQGHEYSGGLYGAFLTKEDRIFIAGDFPWNNGAALDRARRLLVQP